MIVDDHATHGGPLNGLTEFAEYEVASMFRQQHDFKKYRWNNTNLR